MNKVYRHKALAPDDYLGWVNEEGKVYESRFGPDRYIGRVDIGNGRIYESRLGPDQLIGHVELDTGKVYINKLGPDEYLGKVNPDGSLYHHKRLAPDNYLGKVKDMVSLGHGGAAFLLLIMPVYDEEAEEASKREKDEPQGGTAPAEPL